ncbi:hypothetical protein [Cryptosporidium hominis TU502]|uniref:hypothetical protein n=1 Tax=Cryptosporidium hominis (strain TU502) TaxID=353151 RepID=UPI0000453501|nr:hypothetical protein [Cryptosporidium hominis TU502]
MSSINSLSSIYCFYLSEMIHQIRMIWLFIKFLCLIKDKNKNGIEWRKIYNNFLFFDCLNSNINSVIAYIYIIYIYIYIYIYQIGAKNPTNVCNIYNEKTQVINHW